MTPIKHQVVKCLQPQTITLSHSNNCHWLTFKVQTSNACNQSFSQLLSERFLLEP